MTVVLAWSLVDGLSGAVLGLVAGLVVGLLARPKARAPAPDPEQERERLRAFLASDPRRTGLVTVEPEVVQNRVQAAWDKGWRDSIVDRCVAADDAFVRALVTNPALRTTAARLVHAFADRPDGVSAVRAALVPVARAVPLSALLPADPSARLQAIRTTYERLARDHVVRTLATLDLRKHLRAADVVAVMDDDLLRRTTAQVLRLFSRDKERLRVLHAAIATAYGDQTLLSVGPFQLSVGDLLRRFVTVAAVQDQLSRGSQLLEKQLDPRVRQVRDAGVETALGWLDAWNALAPEQRQRAVTALHDRVWPLVLPVVADAVADTFSKHTLADVLDALPDEQLPAWLHAAAVALEQASPGEPELQALATAGLEAWRALPQEDRRTLARTAVDALAPAAVTLLSEWLSGNDHGLHAVDTERLVTLVAAAAPPVTTESSGIRWVPALAGAVAGLVASLV